jgi:hypothetical protein
MSLDLERSIESARHRLRRPAKERARADAGRPRAATSRSRAILEALLSGQERPPMRTLLADLQTRCAAAGEPCPSRASVYNFLPLAPVPAYGAQTLPPHVRDLLYNLSTRARVPGSQLAFYLVNHGDTRALGFAAGMPWLCLYQAERMRGFRPKSHALLRAILQARGI